MERKYTYDNQLLNILPEVEIGNKFIKILAEAKIIY
tara:strand:- start:370 stop:477 length:108 start_codon:yes stop_codon:yes gene_type:complete